MTTLIQHTPSGIYCPQGDFFIDPWKPVHRAIITHAHSDHARWGSKQYLAAQSGQHVLRIRLGQNAEISCMPFGESRSIGGVKLTFVPAGHILGSAQVRLEHQGEVVVISGDYKRNRDPTCVPFQPIRCHTFVTESTFGLPIYHWPDPEDVFQQINSWWQTNQASGKTTILLAYSLGKAQRMLAGIDRSIGPIYTHGSIEKLNVGYRATGVDLPHTQNVTSVDQSIDWSQSLVIAPPSAMGTTWTKRFGKTSVGMASGWMQIRGTRRRRNMDRGFVLSDHVDWNDLITTIEETEAESVWVTHGYSEIVCRYLNEQGRHARVLETEFTGEQLVEEEIADQSGEAGQAANDESVPAEKDANDTPSADHNETGDEVSE